MRPLLLVWFILFVGEVVLLSSWSRLMYFRQRLVGRRWWCFYFNSIISHYYQINHTTIPSHFFKLDITLLKSIICWSNSYCMIPFLYYPFVGLMQKIILTLIYALFLHLDFFFDYHLDQWIYIWVLQIQHLNLFQYKVIMLIII